MKKGTLPWLFLSTSSLYATSILLVGNNSVSACAAARALLVAGLNGAWTQYAGRNSGKNSGRAAMPLHC